MEPQRVIITTEDSPNMQRSRLANNNSGRSPKMRILAQVSNNSIRRSPPRSLRSAHDGAGLNYSSGSSSVTSSFLMNQSIPVHSYDYSNYRGPYMGLQSTPIANISLPSHHDTFGSQIDYNLSWMPKDLQLSDPVDLSSIFRDQSRGLRFPDRFLQREVNIDEDDDVGDPVVDQSSDVNTQHLLDQLPAEDFGKEFNTSANQESLIEWFDKVVEKELAKRRDSSYLGENIVNMESPSATSTSKRDDMAADAATSNVDVLADLRQEQQTDLMEAVDKLAKAEAMCMFEGAVKAAEKAAKEAPPEYAEEAAAAGAQGFQAEITNTIKQEIPGIKPIEVLGYVGITRPKKPKKSNYPGT